MPGGVSNQHTFAFFSGTPPGRPLRKERRGIFPTSYSVTLALVVPRTPHQPSPKAGTIGHEPSRRTVATTVATTRGINWFTAQAEFYYANEIRSHFLWADLRQRSRTAGLARQRTT